MIPMQHLLALFFAVVAPPESLSPEAGEHNTAAMRFYDAGQLASAVDEFYAAYQSMPDARRDRKGRELLLGSMRMTLLNLHDQTGEPAPLCRLQSVLKEHVDALAAAYPDDPDMPELRSVRARHDEVTQQLASFGAHACEPPAPAPPPVVAASTPPAPVQAAPEAASTSSSDVIPPRQLKIAGGVTLGLSAALLGVMFYGIATEASQRARVAEVKDRSPDCPLTPTDLEELQALRQNALFGRRIAIGTGIAAGVTTALGVTLLALAHRSARPKRWSAAPWWSPSGAGLTLRVRFGAAR